MSTTHSPQFQQGLQTSRYFNVAGLAFWAYDCCISLETESRWIWGRPWNLTRVIYTLARYTPLVGSTMTVYSAVVIRTGNCHPFNVAQHIIHIIGIVSAEGILIQRTYTFWDRNKRLGLFLITLAVILIALTIFIPTRVHAPKGYDNPGSCLFFGGRMDATIYGFLLLYDLVLLHLIVYKRFQSYRYTSSSVIITLYRDGLIYISCITFLTLMNIIVAATVSPGYLNVLDTLQTTVPSVLSCRVLINLRRVNALAPPLIIHSTLMPVTTTANHETAPGITRAMPITANDTHTGVP